MYDANYWRMLARNALVAALNINRPGFRMNQQVLIAQSALDNYEDILLRYYELRNEAGRYRQALEQIVSFDPKSPHVAAQIASEALRPTVNFKRAFGTDQTDGHA